MTTTLATAAEAITAALHDRDLATARRHFDAEVEAGTEPGLLARTLAATVTLPAGMVVWGFELDIWANPRRDPNAYAWRCGDCRWTASHYRTERAAQASAGEHAREQHRGRTQVVSYLDEAYWNAVDGGGDREEEAADLDVEHHITNVERSRAHD